MGHVIVGLCLFVFIVVPAVAALAIHEHRVERDWRDGGW